MHNIREESNPKKIRGKIVRMLMITVIAVSLLFILNSLMSEPADAAGYNTAPPAGQSLLEDHFGVFPQLINQGGGRYSFDRNSLIPANPAEVGWTEIDWFGTWSYSDWSTTTQWGTVPSGGEWYDVEAMYLDNDADNIYVTIITSCPHYFDWSTEIVGAPAGVGIYESRYASYPIYKFVLPGDLCIDLGNSPRDEKGTTSTSYDLGIDIVHEMRNPKDPNTVSIWGDSQQHCIQSMRDTQVGYQLYQTTADPGGLNLGDPYLDIGVSPKYDWYTANVHEISEWQHTNFDPLSSWGNMPAAVAGGDDVTVHYYEYVFPGGFRENNAGTFIIEVTIPRNKLAAIGEDPQPGDTIGIQWVTGCRNEGVKTASTSIEIKGTIGDFVWDDADTDGCQDVGEDGIAGVDVELWESGGVSPFAYDTTDTNGYYQFSVNPGNYYVKFIKPSGWSFTAQDAGCGGDDKDSDANPTTGITSVFTLGSGASDLTRDCGMYPDRAQIGDKVWHDLDYDGLQDAGEPGINNVKVELYESGTVTPLSTTYTSTSGAYTFSNLEPDDYFLKFYIPTASGYLFTKKDAGNDATDSDADSFGTTAITTLSPGETDYSWDCGMYKKGKIGDYVWEDKNGDGIQNDGATGISGLTVDLYYWGGSFADTTSTDGSGYYYFDVDPGQYYVKFIKGSYDIFTLQNVGSDNLDSDANSAGNTAQITITSGEQELQWDAGLIEYALLGDFVWHDQNGNGAQDMGEPGMGGLTVRLYDSGGLVGTTTTNSGGLYLFNSLEPGNYYVEFTHPVDYFFSPKDATSDNLDSDPDATGQTDWVTLDSGEEDRTVDAGLMTAPETVKVLVGTIYYNEQLVDYLEATDNEYNEIISSDTIIYLNYSNPALLAHTYFRIWRWDSTLEDWVLLFDWMTTEEGALEGLYPINLCDVINETAEEALAPYYDTSCCDFVYPCCGLYEIEFYSVDIYDNPEPLKWNDLYVDCQPPVSTKTYGFPHVVEWWSEETVHWITSETTITITADDGFGSGIDEIWYKIYYPNGTLYTTPNRPDNFTLYTGSITVDGPDGTYLIYYKASDIIGHVERERKQKFVLDNDLPLGEGSMMWFDPSSQTVGQSMSSSVDIYLDTAIPLQGVQFDLEFNPLLISIDSIDVHLPLFSTGTIDNIAGTVTGLFGAYDTGSMVGGNLIATVYFTASGSALGDTPLVLTNVLALDEGGVAVPVLVWDGSVTVTGQTPSCPYDLTGDGFVDTDDIDVVASHFGETGYPGVVPGDVSGPEGVPDGVVNIFDIIAVAHHFGDCP